jgi:hypothetical protein
MLKILTVAVAGVLTAMTLKRVYDELRLQRARVKATDPRQTPAVTRLRQDPRSGIYFPEA